MKKAVCLILAAAALIPCGYSYSHSTTFTTDTLWGSRRLATKEFERGTLSFSDWLDFSGKRVDVYLRLGRYYSDTVHSYIGRYHSSVHSTGWQQRTSVNWSVDCGYSSYVVDADNLNGGDYSGQVDFLNYIGETERASELEKQISSTRACHIAGYVVLTLGCTTGLVLATQAGRWGLKPALFSSLGAIAAGTAISIPLLCIDTRKAKVTFRGAVDLANTFNEKLYNSYAAD